MVAVNGTVDIVPTGKSLGAIVHGIDLGNLDSDQQKLVSKAWNDHLVLCFRDQSLKDEDFLAFSRKFGDLDVAPVPAANRVYRLDLPEIAVISNVVVDGKPIGALGDAEAEWHTDMSYNPDPPKASILYAIEIPPKGGDTGFCNMYEAYETLPEPMKKSLEGLHCKHDSSRNSVGQVRKGFKETYENRDDVPGAIHPLVCTHPETKRKVLYLGRRLNAYIPELPPDESDALLNELWAHATRPELTWHTEWQVHDVVMWDNRCTMHRRDSFDANSRRIMRRTQVKGGKMH